MKHTHKPIAAICCAIALSVTFANAYRYTPFIIKVQTDNPGTSENNEFTIPTNPIYSYDYDVDCDNDGIYEMTGMTSDATCSYLIIKNPPPRTISIRGLFPTIYFNNSGDKEKLISVEQWGDQSWKTMYRAFYGCSNMEINASDAPDFSDLTQLTMMFTYASKMNSDLSNWDVSHVTNMNSMFYRATQFNQPIGNWDVSHVTNMTSMFYGAESFDQNISDWNVSSVTYMQNMFYNAKSFNQDIGGWNVSSVTTMESMFENASAFNSSIDAWNPHGNGMSNWDVSHVTNMKKMFKQATLFNIDIGEWDVSSVTDMTEMFSGALAFNQDLGDWNISSVVSFDNLFQDVNLSVSNYDHLLLSWEKLPLTNMTFNAGNSHYCRAVNAWENLTNQKNWTITDAGMNCDYHSRTPYTIHIKNGQKDIPGFQDNHMEYDHWYITWLGEDVDLFYSDLINDTLTFKTAPDVNHPADMDRNNIYRVQILFQNNEINANDLQTVRIIVDPDPNPVIIPVISYLLQ